MKIQRIIGSMVILAALGAHAQNETGTSRGYLTNEPVADRWAGWAPFVGLNAGYMADDDEAVKTEGIPGSVKIIGSYVTPNMNYVFDGGVGYNHQRFDSEDVEDRDLGTTVGELAARYQWANRWQAGVVWNTLFNEGENYGANQADAQFAGLQVLKEFAIANGWMMRVGGRYMADVNVEGTYLNTAMVDVEFGYNPWSGRRGVQEAAYTAPAQRPIDTSDTMNDDMDNEAEVARGEDEGPAMTGMPMPVSDRMGTEELWARRDFLLFDTSSATLDAGDTDRLERLAAALNDNPDMVGKIQVIGYADPRGDEAMNKDLSQQRADSVKKALIDKGVPEDKITVVARGEAAPLSTNEKSRRAELHFQDVKDPEALRRVVTAVE